MAGDPLATSPMMPDGMSPADMPASPLAAQKKDAVVAGAERALSGTRWLPDCLRTASTSDSNTGEAQSRASTDEEASALAA